MNTKLITLIPSNLGQLRATLRALYDSSFTLPVFESKHVRSHSIKIIREKTDCPFFTFSGKCAFQKVKFPLCDVTKGPAVSNWLVTTPRVFLHLSLCDLVLQWLWGVGSMQLFSVELPCCRCVCVGSPQVLRLPPPHRDKHIQLMINSKLSMSVSVGGCLSLYEAL